MAVADFERAFDVMIHHEAFQRRDGTWIYWVDDPDDSGGQTAWGWSMLTIQREIKSGRMVEADLGLTLPLSDPRCLATMTLATARKLYRAHFWEPLMCGAIDDQRVATKVFDFGVNAGKWRTILFAQETVNQLNRVCELAEDAQVGPLTIAGINTVEPDKFLVEFGRRMEAHYRDQVVKKPANAKFLEKQWLPRAHWVG